MSIYVLRSDNLVKIGFSEMLRTRVNAIIGAVPVPVEFVGHMPGGRDVEAHLHSIFAEYRFSGEWFRETEDMRRLFDVLLIRSLPKPEPRNDKKRTDNEVVKALSALMKAQAAKRWPNESKGDHVKKLAASLGWNQTRTKDIYYCDPRIAVRAFEQDEIRAWAGEDA